jgi:hypothetical protein
VKVFAEGIGMATLTNIRPVLYQAVEKRPSAAFPSSFAVQRTRKYASRLRISGALHLDIFEQPA